MNTNIAAIEHNGKYENIGIQKTAITAIAILLIPWEILSVAPARTFNAERAKDAVAGKPPHIPEAIFARPRPIISRD